MNSYDKVRELCESHLIYLLDMGFTYLIVDTTNGFKLTLSKPFRTLYNAYSLSDIEPDFGPLYDTFNSIFIRKNIYLFALTDKYILKDLELTSLEFNIANFMELTIYYEFF